MGKTRVDTSNRNDLDMSFSGLKSAVRNHLEKTPEWVTENVAASFQAAVLDVLLDRVVRAMKDTGVRRITIGGGVAANSGFQLVYLHLKQTYSCLRKTGVRTTVR